MTSFPKILLAATLAGVPSASLVTPADVIKTRLQVRVFVKIIRVRGCMLTCLVTANCRFDIFRI